MAERLRTLIVDDEPAAVRRLRRLCEADDALIVAATAASAGEALAVLAATPVDLALLDVRMPGTDGLALAALVGRLPAPPAIVFTTAYPDFAVAAFGVDAVGYLTKPVDPDELAATVRRIARRRAPMAASPAALWVPERGALIRLDPAAITHISGEDDYVRVHAAARSWLLAERLTAVADRLAPLFLRIHRSHLVNGTAVTALRSDAGGAWTAILHDGSALPIGRTYLVAVRDRLAAAAG